MLPTAYKQCRHGVFTDQHTDQPPNPQPHTPSPPTPEHPTLDPFETPPDDAGLFHIYPTYLMLLPNNNMLESVTDALTLAGSDWTTKSSHITKGLSLKEISNDNLYAAFSNPTASLLMAY